MSSSSVPIPTSFKVGALLLAMIIIMILGNIMAERIQAAHDAETAQVK